MPESANEPLRLEIAHVLFMDIVGYSKLLMDEQAEALQELKQVVRATKAARDAEAANQLIRLPTGDGMALVFAGSVEAPVDCALEISRALRTLPGLLLRMGIHSGPVQQVADVNERTNFAGAGINMAQRVMDCGDAGHILLSRRVADDLAQSRRWQPYLHDLGVCEVKHGVVVPLVNIYGEDVGNPARPVKLGKPSKHSRIVPASATGKAQSLAGVWLATALAGIGLMAAAWFMAHRRPERAALSARPAASATLAVATVPEKSIAVLPFENLSEDLSQEKTNEFFTEGVQDEILTDLAKIADLKVISRTSVMQYKSGAPRNLREIGRQLGVLLLLEGSVQRMANQVRVNAQLIDARTDAHLWAQTYDRNLADVFAIQSEIAEGIADQLRSKLSPTERAAIAAPPTTNLAAYQLYTEALPIEVWNSPAGVAGGLARRADLLHQATQRDPTFALAYCLLAHTECDFVIAGFTDHLPSEKAAAETALRLQPNLGEAHREMARYEEKAGLFPQARAEIEIARRTLPNDSETFRIAGDIEWAAGHWDAAIANMEKAFDHDPHNLEVLYFLSQEYRATRRYSDWRRALARESSPDPGTIYWADLLSAELDLNMGDAKAAQTLLDRIPESFTPTSEIWGVRVTAALYLRDYPRVLQVGARIPARYRDGEEPWVPASDWGKGLPGWSEGDAEKSQAIFASVRWNIDFALEDSDAAALLHAGLSEAGAGRKDQAIAKGREAIATTAGHGDFTKANAAIGFAKVCTLLHEPSVALDLLQTSATQISGITYGDLRLDPSWDGLRGEPRFETITASLAPSAP